MISKFKGKGGKVRRIKALRLMDIVKDEQAIAEALDGAAKLIQIEPGSPDEEFIKQDANDTDIYFIIAGKVSIRINGREVATRGTGDHVGEMAVIDPTARRSTSVVAIEKTVLAKVSEAHFTRIASEHSQLWRRLAVELGNRLRERGRHVPFRNATPELFIGSAAENLAIAQRNPDWPGGCPRDSDGLD